jgi:hypothetical protein
MNTARFFGEVVLDADGAVVVVVLVAVPRVALRVAVVGRGAGRLLPLEPCVGRSELVLLLAAQLPELGAGRAR